MRADRKKLELAMARACMSSSELASSTNLPRPTVNNVISGKGIRPSTLGKIAKALGVDPVDIIETEE